MARRRIRVEEVKEEEPKEVWTEAKIEAAIKKGGIIDLDEDGNNDHHLIPCGGMWTHISTEDYQWEIVKEPITDPVDHILEWQRAKLEKEKREKEEAASEEEDEE